MDKKQTSKKTHAYAFFCCRLLEVPVASTLKRLLSIFSTNIFKSNSVVKNIREWKRQLCHVKPF